MPMRKELIELLAPRGVRLIVNDRADIAAMAGAAGVHVGQETCRRRGAHDLRPSCWVGVSTHNSRAIARGRPHFGGLYCRGAHLPDSHERESRPGRWNRVPAGGAPADAQAACGDRRDHAGVSRGCISRRSRFGRGRFEIFCRRQTRPSGSSEYLAIAEARGRCASEGATAKWREQAQTIESAPEPPRPLSRNL